MKSLVVTAVVLVSMCAVGAQTSDPVALAAKVQQRYNGIKDISGDFVQTYEGGVLRTKTTERGTIAIKRPGRMRFLYTKPEKKEFVSDGNRLYAHMVADKQVIVSPAPGPDQGDIPAMFLAGQSDLTRDYTPSFTALPGAAQGLLTLKLDSQEAKRRIRINRDRRRPENPPDPVPDGGRHARRAIVVFLH